MNNDPENLVVLPKYIHRLIHTKFGNILIRGIHTGALSREDFFNICTDEEKEILRTNYRFKYNASGGFKTG